MRFWFLFLLIQLIGFNSEGALTIPSLSGPVIDQAGILTPDEEREIELLIRTINNKGLAQFQVWTVPSLEDDVIENVTIKAVEKWQLGTGKNDDGLLLFIAWQDKKLRIEVGQGLEGTIPDVIASRVIREVIAPWFRENKPGNGIKSGLVVLAQQIDPNFQSSEKVFYKKSTRKSNLITLIIWIIFVLFFFLGGGFSRRHYRSGRYLGKRTGLGGIGNIFGGGGGGWSGGGGGFSGGGSSGSW